MKDESKTKDQLLCELEELRRRVRESEALADDLLRTQRMLEEELALSRENISPLADTFYILGADGKLMPRIPRPGRTAGAGGPPAPMNVVGSDESVQKSAEEELRRYREHLEELVEDRTLEVMLANERLQNEIAERKLIEQELLVRNDELEAFAHTVSHDLCNSISIIEGYARVALEQRGELLQECLEKIIYLTRRMSDFIAALLAYCEVGRLEGSPVEVNPREMLREILAEREAEIKDRKVTVVIEEGLPAVRVDPVRLQQVFINLFDNALKYLGENPAPEVRCSAYVDEGVVVFQVSDNGIGIPEAEHEKVFEPFRRLSSEGYHGLGIGLSTVKRAVEGWGGEVWVRSAPGLGSTFFFTVPRGGPDTGRE